MKLYTKPGACSTADHIALAWSGLPYEFEIVKDSKSPEYLAINPAGAVPALQDGDWVLTQNAAIMHYIGDLAPQAGLFGDGSPKQTAEANRWLSFINADVHPAFKPLFGSVSYLDEATQKQVKDNALETLRGYFVRMNEQLKTNDYLAGFRSAADAYAFIVARWAKGVGVDLSGLDALKAYMGRMRDDAGVQAAFKAEGLG